MKPVLERLRGEMNNRGFPNKNRIGLSLRFYLIPKIQDLLFQRLGNKLHRRTLIQLEITKEQNR